MRLIIVSNRAPVSVVKNNGGYAFGQSSGGLASGLRTYIDHPEMWNNYASKIIWIGWPGMSIDDTTLRNQTSRQIMEKFGVQSVFLPEQMMENFYEGFCNKTIWPLFHYFTGYTIYEHKYWEDYIAVNRIFCQAVMEIARPDDVIWVHDYHLMLLPGMLRKEMPGASIGFFLHIPFPSFEVFRLLPSRWRQEILSGLYGADLIGFHTHDYRTYFLQSTLRILGLDDQMGEVFYNNRMVRVDTFPMGIDYQKYHNATSLPEVENEISRLDEILHSRKLILSIDRQDYSKGILNRLNAYDHFLSHNQNWLGKITMVLVVVPSRSGVEDYQAVKNQIDGLIGKINGAYGSLDWMPIIYQYRSLSFSELSALYARSDIALITPLRDGMNLIAKEYIASRSNGTGVLILSEMAGASEELDESVVINPNNTEEISNAFNVALEMSPEEQKRRIDVMQQRISTYNVLKWAEDFITTLKEVRKKQARLQTRMLLGDARDKMVQQFNRALKRLLFLDYDGTLIPFSPRPLDAFPGKHLIEKLRKLTALENLQLVIISGRDKTTMQNWFGELPVNLAAEHGLFIREAGGEWQLLKPVRNLWKKKILPVMKHFEEKLPGAFVEEKEYSLVFHYRRSDPEFASLRVKELMNHVVTLTANMDIQLLNGNKIMEVRNAGIDKGIAALHWLSKLESEPFSFVLSIGDDATDEDMFKAMPGWAYSVKVGLQSSHAKFNLLSSHDVMKLLDSFIESDIAEQERRATSKI